MATDILAAAIFVLSVLIIAVLKKVSQLEKEIEEIKKENKK
jgi:uncharacterized protein YoxC